MAQPVPVFPDYLLRISPLQSLFELETEHQQLKDEFAKLEKTDTSTLNHVTWHQDSPLIEFQTQTDLVLAVRAFTFLASQTISGDACIGNLGRLAWGKGRSCLSFYFYYIHTQRTKHTYTNTATRCQPFGNILRYSGLGDRRLCFFLYTRTVQKTHTQTQTQRFAANHMAIL
jgi:hypothetical protein